MTRDDRSNQRETDKSFVPGLVVGVVFWLVWGRLVCLWYVFMYMPTVCLAEGLLVVIVVCIESINKLYLLLDYLFCYLCM